MGYISLKKYIDLEDMSHVNCAHVLSVIRDCGEASRKQISDITGLSWGGMTKIVNKLFESGYIVEGKSENVSGIGRTPNIIRLNKEQNFVIGLDINRMGFGAYVMNLAGEVQKEYTLEESFDSKEELLQTILGFTQGIIEDFKEKRISAVGVAMQGMLDIKRGVSIRFPHCHDWKNVPVKEILEEAFGIPVFMEHDPNCMLYSVMNEEESENMLLFRIDSSVGMAASVGGRIIRGNGLLEVAHCVMVPGGRLCRCGKRGCLEAYVSPCLAKGKLNEQEIPQMIEPLAVCMNNMVRIFHSDKIILTGRLMKYRSVFEETLLDKFYEYCEKEDATVEVVQEPGLAVHGAALIAVQGAIDQVRI